MIVGEVMWAKPRSPGAVAIMGIIEAIDKFSSGETQYQLRVGGSVIYREAHELTPIVDYQIDATAKELMNLETESASLSAHIILCSIQHFATYIDHLDEIQDQKEKDRVILNLVKLVRVLEYQVYLQALENKKQLETA